MTLEQIRDRIEKNSLGKLLPEEVVETMKAIEAFKAAHHYLPNDVEEWYDYMYDIYMEEQEEQLTQQAEYEEYRDLLWEYYFKD